MLSTPDARLSLGLLTASCLSLAAFLWLGFGEVPARSSVAGTPLVQSPGRAASTRFVDATARLGLDGFVHDTGPLRDLRDTVAPGLGLLDLDGDEDLDLVLLGGPAHETGVSIFVNEGGDPRFVDRTDELGIRWRGNAQGICAGDYDADGDLDLYVTALGRNLLLQSRLTEEGRLGFVDATETAGVGGERYHLRSRDGRSVLLPGGPELREDVAVAEFSTGASFGDYDGDGLLDLFVANYLAVDPALADGEGPGAEFRPSYPGLQDRLYRNRGQGRFEEVTAPAGLGDPSSCSLSAAFFQADDRRPEIYVAQDAQRGNEVLRSRPPLRPGLPVTFARDELGYDLADVGSSNGFAVGDADNDGDVDIAVSNGPGAPHSLYLSSTVLRPTAGLPPVRFGEAGHRSRIAEGTAELHGRGVVWFDADNDGRLDLAVAHGGGLPGPDGMRCSSEPLMLFENLGAGRFAEVGRSAGLQDEGYRGRGLVAGDLDGDGDQDLVLAQNNGPVILFENQLPTTRHHHMVMWMSMPDLRRADGIGARLLMNTEQGAQQLQVVSGGSYLSQGPLSLHLGLGRERQLDVDFISPYPQRMPDRNFVGVTDVRED